MSLENLSDDARDQLAQLAQSMANNPKTRDGFLRMTKYIRPETSIPEIDLQDKATSFFKTQTDKIASLEARLSERDATEGIQSARQAVIDAGLASRADIADIEKLMIEKRIPDHKTAAEFHKMQKQVATPTPSSVQHTPISLPESIKDIMKNPTQWSRNEATKALTELRNR